MMRHWLASVFIGVLLIAVVAVSGCNKDASATDDDGRKVFQKTKNSSTVPSNAGTFENSNSWKPLPVALAPVCDKERDYYVKSLFDIADFDAHCLVVENDFVLRLYAGEGKVPQSWDKSRDIYMMMAPMVVFDVPAEGRWTNRYTKEFWGKQYLVLDKESGFWSEDGIEKVSYGKGETEYYFLLKNRGCPSGRYALFTSLGGYLIKVQ